jgi:hypothetical protein
MASPPLPTGSTAQNPSSIPEVIKIKDGLPTHFESQKRQQSEAVKYSYPLDNQHNGTDGSARETYTSVVVAAATVISAFENIPENTVQILYVNWPMITLVTENYTEPILQRNPLRCCSCMRYRYWVRHLISEDKY